MKFYSNPMDVGMINYTETYHLFMSQQNFSYFAIPDFWGLKQKTVFTSSSEGGTLQRATIGGSCTSSDLKVNAPPFTPKPNNLIITQDIVNNLNKLIDNKIVFQDKQSSFFEFTDQTLFECLE